MGTRPGGTTPADVTFMPKTKHESCGQCLVIHPTDGWLFQKTLPSHYLLSFTFSESEAIPNDNLMMIRARLSTLFTQPMACCSPNWWRASGLFPRKPLAKSGRRWWLHSTAQMATPIFSSDFGATIGPAAQLSFWPPWLLNKDVVNLPSYPFQIRLFSNLSYIKKDAKKQEQIFLQLWQSERFSHWARPTLFSLVQSQTA